MALKTEYAIRCVCKKRFTAPVCEYILADHDPELKDAILSGDFNRVACPSCGLELPVEIPFLYRDEKNSLFVWVCPKKDEKKRKKMEKELLEKKSGLECHFVDGVKPGNEMLVFGREALVRLLLLEDQQLKKREGRWLKKNPAVWLYTKENVPVCLVLRGDKVRAAVPLAFPRGAAPVVDSPQARKIWLKNYAMGANLHNPYSSLLTSRMQKEWERVRLEEPLRGAGDEFEDFASSWAHFRVDPKGLQSRFAGRRRFFDSLKGMEIPRKVQPLCID